MLFTLPPAETMQAKRATRAKKMMVDFILFDFGLRFDLRRFELI